MYVATWLDNYDEDFGAYKAFESERDCLDYLVETIFERARNLGVKVLDVNRPRTTDEWTVEYPTMRRKSVLKRLMKDRKFSIPLRIECGKPVDEVTVGYSDVEVEYA